MKMYEHRVQYQVTGGHVKLRMQAFSSSYSASRLGSNEEIFMDLSNVPTPNGFRYPIYDSDVSVLVFHQVDLIDHLKSTYHRFYFTSVVISVFGNCQCVYTSTVTLSALRMK